MNSSTSNSEPRPVRRFLLRIALPFLAVMIPACWGFDAWFTHSVILSTEPEGAAKLNRLFYNNDPAELVCIGNSRINNGLNPDSISPKAYNYGMNGASYSLLEMAIRTELGRERRTPLIVGIDMNFFSNEVDNSVYAIPHFSARPEARAFMREVETARPWHHVPAIRYFGNYEWYTQRFLSARQTEYTGCSYVRGGCICKGSFNPQMLRKVEGTHKVIHPDASFMGRFYRLLLQHPERRTVLVRMPYHPKYYGHFTMDGNMDYFMEKVAQLPQVTIIDFTDGRFGEECFKDLTHLNDVGAHKFSGALRRELDARGISLE